MGTLKGPIVFTGSIGTIRVYYDPARKAYTVATKGGTNSDIIANSDNCKIQRLNMQEFKGASIWAKQLGKTLRAIDHLHYGYYFPKIVGMGKIIMKYDELGHLGQRRLESSKASRLLTTINFNKLHPFDEVLTQPYSISFSDDKRTVTLKMSGFNSKNHIHWPERYASFRITLTIGQQPDFFWSAHSRMYEPVILSSESLSVSSYTEWSSQSTESMDILLEASFVQPALQIPGTAVVVGMGIEFSTTEVEPSNYRACGVGTLKIVECFV